MRPRDAHESHRASTPLELLFDLTFVVAVSQAAGGLGRAVAADHLGPALIGYLEVFFAIWWAWMNFTWFASAYDTDDVPYRLLTLLQMAGVLVLAAGVPRGFDGDSTTLTVGYVLMRVAALTQWARAGRADPSTRDTAYRYVVGIAVVQVAWLLRLALPAGLGHPSFAVLALAELAVPVWAGRRVTTPWHPHHIAERFGLFTIIVLGECVLAATVAVQAAFDDGGLSADLLTLAVGGLLLLFALWWFYFLQPAGDGLASRPEASYLWGYGHYGIFAGLAAVGGGLEVAAEAPGHDVAAPDAVVAAAVAWPTALVLVLIWALHAGIGVQSPHVRALVAPAVVATLAVPGLTALGLPLPLSILLTAVPAAVLVAAGASAPPVGTGPDD